MRLIGYFVSYFICKYVAFKDSKAKVALVLLLKHSLPFYAEKLAQSLTLLACIYEVLSSNLNRIPIILKFFVDSFSLFKQYPK
jgi:hypothetical protein